MTNLKENSMVKFIDTLPAAQGGKRGKWDGVVNELRGNRGNWAEIERGTRTEQGRLASIGTVLRRRGGIEATTRTIGNEVVLYARAIS